MKKTKAFFLIIFFIIGAMALSLVACGGGGGGDNPPEKTEWPEAGTYYYSVGGVACELTLNVGGSFVIVRNGSTEGGSFTLDGGVLALDFDNEGSADITASYEDGIITLTYHGMAMRMLKKVNYTVKFDSVGGSAVPDMTVLNGQGIAVPTSPEKEGHIFVGWYKDSTYKTPFTPMADIVTSDITLYARWTEDIGSEEYTVKFDIGYEGAQSFEIETRGGKLFDIAAPEREGYTFLGWWISCENDAEMPSYKWGEDTVFTSDTTLFALWSEKGSTKIEYPSIKIGEGNISWGAVKGARSYDVMVTDADGSTVYTKATSTTSVSFSFSALDAGRYTVTVRANASSGDSDSSKSYYTYVNRGLDRVSGFFVSGEGVLVFDGVENAEKYLITVSCGNKNHKHTNLDIGKSTAYSFVNCPMTDGGIGFVVTAVADGYLSSVSESFVYKRELSPIGEITFDEERGIVSWAEIAGAQYYAVLVECANTHHSHSFVNNVVGTSFDLRSCVPLKDGITVKVYPCAEGYISPAPTEIKVNKTLINTPSDIAVIGNTLTFSEVVGADKYEVSVNGEIHEIPSLTLDLSAFFASASEITVAVRAVGDTVSPWSDSISVYNTMNTDIVYSKGAVYWSSVYGAEHYEISVNGGEIISVGAGITSLKINLTKSGENIIRVRFAAGEYISDWASVTVVAYSITLDARGGNPAPTQYKAAGDIIELPAAQKAGYDFVGWYNVPGGADTNGKELGGIVIAAAEDSVFYAYYTPKKYEVTFNFGDGGTGDYTSYEIEYDREYTLPVPEANEATVTFGGWFSEPYGKGVQYTDSMGSGLAPWSTVGGAELYAFWIDEAMHFELVLVNGKTVYSVSAGPRISLVKEITVPAYYNGYAVAMVDGGAFLNCTALEVINLPETVEIISSNNPFAGCDALTEINVYKVDSVGAPRYKSYGGALFENKTDGTVALIRVPMGKIGSYTVPSDTDEIANGAFSGALLSEVVISEQVSKIANDAFSGCKNLASVIFRASLSADGERELTVGKRAFSGCVSLESITLPARLSDIELTKYSINDNGKVIESVDQAFYGCTSLKEIKVEQGSRTYKEKDGMIYSADLRHLIYCPIAKVGKINITVGTQSVSAGAFIGCNGITGVTLANTVTYVGEYAFYGLSASEVTFGGRGLSEVTIGDGAFAECKSLAKVTFDEGGRIAVIGAGAFSGCSALTSMDIPASVNTVRDNAFSNCTGLLSVSFGAGGRALTFGKDVFRGCSVLATVNIPKGVAEIPGIFAGCSALTEVVVDSENPYLSSDGGVVFNKDKTEIVYYPEGKGGIYRIPESVTVIGDGVFYGNKVIDELIIPNTVSHIGEGAFFGTKIGRITFSGDSYAESLTIANDAFRNAYFENYNFELPKHTKTIGEYAFSGIYYQNIILNEGLEEIGAYAFYLPSGTNGGTVKIPASVEKIGEYCFGGASESYGSISFNLFVGVEFTKENSRLTEIADFAFYKNIKITSVELPDSVKVIGNYAFYECHALQEVKLSSSLEVIGAYAFAASSNTYKLLISEITIPASVREIGAHAFEYCQNLTKVNFEGGKDSPDLAIGTTYLRSYESDGVEMLAVERGNAFASCTKLKEVNLSENVISLADYTFSSSGDSGFVVNIPDSSRLQTIGAYCFYKSRLTSFTVPASVRNLEPVTEYGVDFNRLGIGEYAFAATNGSLTEIIFLKDENNYPLTIGQFAFENQDELTEIELPERLASYTGFDGEVISPLANGSLVFSGATKISSVTSGGAYTSVGGILFTADMKELVFCPALTEGEVTIPASVEKIHSFAFFGCASVSAVSFAGGDVPLVIGDYAFYGCSGIGEITLPTRAVALGEGAFVNCRSLEVVTVSKGINELSIFAFSGCESLKNLFVEEGNTSYLSLGGVLYSADKSTLILYPVGREDTSYTADTATTSVGMAAFSANTYIEKITLPLGLIDIGANAFSGCTALSEVNIPNTVTRIGESAFLDNTSLSAVTFEGGGTEGLTIAICAFRNIGEAAVVLPARVVYIGDEAFFGAKISSLTFESAEAYSLTEIGSRAFAQTSLVSVKFPAGIARVGVGLLEGALSVKTVEFGEGLVDVGEGAFYGSAIEAVYFPASLKSVGAEAFYNCEYLTTVQFADGSVLEAIAHSTFLGCTSLAEIKIPASVKEIEGGSKKGAFFGCTSLTSVIFESSVSCLVIGDYTFYGCSALADIDIPLSVGTLGDFAFSGCISLKSVLIPFTTTDLGVSLFEGCERLSSVELYTGATLLPERMFYGCKSLTGIIIPASISDVGKDCFALTMIEEFVVAEGNKNLLAISGILYKSSKTEILCFPPNSKTTTLFIPKEVITIPAGNFAGCTNIKEVIFEEGGTIPLIIGEKAFDGCYQLRTLILPERLTAIGKYAFRECFALTSVTIPKNVVSIGDYAFMWCYKLYEVKNESGIENIGSKGSIKTANKNVNIYSATEGESRLFREGDFLFATVGGVKTLIGYYGESSVVVMPGGEYTVSEYLFYCDTSVTKIIFKETDGITISATQAFIKCENLEAIYISSLSKPAGFGDGFAGKMRVIYGYTGEEITYTFEAFGADEIAPVISDGVITLPTPEREGFVFMGWYDNSALSGEPVYADGYYSAVNMSFYASWMEKAVYERLRYGGKSFADAFDIGEGIEQTIYVDKGGEVIYFKLTANTDTVCDITVMPNSDADAVIYIYDASGNQILKIDSANKGKAEMLNHTFEGGAVYYIAFGYFNAKNLGTSEVQISVSAPNE